MKVVRGNNKTGGIGSTTAYTPLRPMNHYLLDFKAHAAESMAKVWSSV